MIYVLRVHLKINCLQIFMGQSTVRFLPKKNNTGTETHRLVYNKFKIVTTMPIRQDDNQPNRRFGIVNIILIGVGALLLSLIHI